MELTHTARTLLAGVCISAALAGHAQAQALDYTSLQQMFGEPITTSVTGSPQRASEAPASMTIVTQDDIRHSGADNLPDVLQFVTGIDIRRYSFGSAQVAVRGYDQPYYSRLLVLLNGRQVYLDDYGYVDWNAIPVVLGEIRQIEVVKGPQSALFGFNAAAGVINIITYDSLLDRTNNAIVRGGTQHLGEGEAVGTVHLGKTFGVRVSVGGMTAQDFSSPPGPDLPSPRYGKLNMDARWQVVPRILLHAEAGLTDSRFTDQSPLDYPQAADNRTNDIRGGVDFDSHYGLIGLDTYRNQVRQIYPAAGGHGYGSNSVTVVKLDDLLRLGSSNTIRAGLEYRKEIESSERLNRGTISYDDYAAALMWDITLSSRLTMVNSVRLDHTVLHSDANILALSPFTSADYNKATITAPSFNSGLVYTASSNDTFRLTLARGLQMPSLIGFGLQAKAGALSFVGSPDLSPAATWNIDLGYNRALESVDSALVADLFLQRTTDLTGAPGNDILPRTPAGVVGVQINVGSSNEAGIEIGIKGHSRQGLRWNASYRFVSISQDITSVVAPATTSRFANGTPTSEIIAGIGYSIAKWEFDLDGRWQSRFYDYNLIGPVEVGNYVTLARRIG